MGLALVTEDKSEWYRCRPWIEAALEYTRGTHSIADIEEGISDSRYFFFSSDNSAVVVEILCFPKAKVLNYFLIGGDLEELIRDIEPPVTAWAKKEGCVQSIGIGRKGFERAFSKSGYSYGWTGIYKDL